VGNYSKIVIRRPKGGFRNILGSYAIDVDGHLRGKLRPGQELSLDVLPGRHIIRARIDWTGSPSQEISVTRDSVVRVCVEPSGNVFQIWKVLSRTGALKLTIEQYPLASSKENTKNSTG
jgi:hypothetical protein